MLYMRSVQDYILEIFPFTMISHSDLCWSQLTFELQHSIKILALYMVHTHTKYEISPSLCSWDIVLVNKAYPCQLVDIGFITLSPKMLNLMNILKLGRISTSAMENEQISNLIVGTTLKLHQSCKEQNYMIFKYSNYDLLNLFNEVLHVNYFNLIF